MDSIAFCPPHPHFDVSLQLLFPHLFRISYEWIAGSLFLLIRASTGTHTSMPLIPVRKSRQSFFTARSSPRPAPSLASIDAASNAQTSLSTHAAAGWLPRSSGKKSVALRAAHAPALHPSALANASKRKAAPSREHPQSLRPAAPAAPSS